MTNNKYWIYLENLREGGTINMYGATNYLLGTFPELDKDKATEILKDWMKNYNKDDYKK